MSIPISVLSYMLEKNGEGGLPVPPVLNNGGKHTAHSNIITDASWVNIGKKEQKNPLSFPRTVINNQLPHSEIQHIQTKIHWEMVEWSNCQYKFVIQSDLRTIHSKKIHYNFMQFSKLDFFNLTYMYNIPTSTDYKMVLILPNNFKMFLITVVSALCG